MYNVYFLARRFMSGFGLIWLSDHPYFQVSMLMVFSTVNFIYQFTEKPMESRKSNFIELLNEFCILLCAYVMNIFLQQAAPPWFMTIVGWVFMGVSVFNIICNVIVIVIDTIYQNGLALKNKKVQMDRLRIIRKRLENLQVINKYSFRALTYIQREIDTQEGLKFVREWWPHYQWLKSNDLPYREFPTHKEFVKICRKMSIRRRVQDVYAAQQALKVAETLTDQEVDEQRLENAKIKQQKTLELLEDKIKSNIEPKVKATVKRVAAQRPFKKNQIQFKQKAW